MQQTSVSGNVIEVFGHFILKSVVIGIGPLLSQNAETDTATYQLYNPRSLHFELHTKSNTIKITSKVFYLYKQEDKDNYDKAIEEYIKLKETLLSDFGYWQQG